MVIPTDPPEVNLGAELYKKPKATEPLQNTPESKPQQPLAADPKPAQPKRHRKTRLTNRRTMHACSDPDCTWQAIRYARKKQTPCPKCGATVMRLRLGRLRLTPREHQLVKEYADPKSPTFANGKKSAIKAGYSQKTATTLASETLAKPNVRKALLREIHAHGGTLALTGKRLAEGLSAHQTRVFLSKDGHLVYSDELVDFDQRRKYAELVSRFEGALPSPQEQERIALLQIQQTFNLVPPIKEEKEPIEIEGTVEE